MDEVKLEEMRKQIEYKASKPFLNLAPKSIKLNELLKQKYLHDNKAVFKSIDFGELDSTLTGKNSEAKMVSVNRSVSSLEPK